MSTRTRRGKIDDFGDLASLDLMQYTGGDTPWGEKAPNWTVAFDSHEAQMFRDQIERIGFAELGNIVDVGSGWGRIGMFLAEVNDAVIGVDHNEGGTLIANKLAEMFGLMHAEFRCGNAHELPVDDSWADGAYVYGVLNYTERGTVISECRRVLKPGGKLFVGKYNCIGMIMRKYLMNYAEDGKSARLTKWARNALLNGPLSDGRANWGDRDSFDAVMARHGFDPDPGFRMHVYPEFDLSDEEVALFKDHERLLEKLENDEGFVRGLLDQGDGLLDKMDGDIDAVYIVR
ncbi:MAG: class I SAM-dependent methyltransferase [Planctomycetota bacterium]